MKYRNLYAIIIILSLCLSCMGQDGSQSETSSESLTIETKVVMAPNSPQAISRTITQDRNGNIWIASFDGVFRYDGESFTNISKEVSSDRFFSVLEDRQGNIWFGSIGSGVYRYDGKSFQNFTTEDGLLNNEILSIYEDEMGHIWFGVNGGVSVYDRESIKNYLISRDSMAEEKTGKTVPDFTRPPNEVNTILQDKTGKYWLATRGYTFVFNGETFTTVKHDDIPFSNVRWLIEDSNGNIWLGGQDGLWRYDGSTFSNVTRDFVGYIYEDKKGNIWTSAEGGSTGGWALSRFDQKTLASSKPQATEVKAGERMLFGILEADDESIWFGALNGVQRYDGNVITVFQDSAQKE